MDRLDYHAIVVGSGFGGSVVAHRLAMETARPWDVCLLERGRAHPPGTFPRTPRDFKRSFWDPSEGLYGLFDVWSFRGLMAVVASGLGGGSLIYANVLERPPAGWLRFSDPDDGSTRSWPITAAELEPHFAAVGSMLPTSPYPAVEPFGSTPKTHAFHAAASKAGLECRRPPLAVQFEGEGGVGARLPFGDPSENRYGVQRLTCEMVGECDVGCNVGAKHTLDLTYLSAAEVRERVTIRELVEVRRIRPLRGGFSVELRDYSRVAAGEEPEPRTETVTCGKLVLAAGTLGTALVLLRSRLSLRGLSARLGRGFCGNGDYLAFVDCEPGANGSGPIEPSRGPVITSSARGADELEGGDGPGFHVQDGGYPAWASWLAQLGGIRRDAMRLQMQARRLALGYLRGDPEDNLSAELSDAIGEAGAHLLPILSLGRETPSGRLHLRGRRLDVEWRKDENAALYERTEATARRMADALDGRYVDPLRMLRPITVHPLGGCAMSNDARDGVVDRYGNVHGVENLSVADGSVLPGPVGINPALTIAALAHRHADWLIENRRPEL